jgi:hypothetical protein
MAEQAQGRADALTRQAQADLSGRHQALLAAEALPKPSEAQRALVDDAERHQWPALAARTTELRAQITGARPERDRLEADYAAVQQRFDRLRKDAEGEVIRRAQVIATTLARLRTSKALMDGPYDVVLVDEVGAANLPEILLAVSRAKRTAVLLGDFLQLSPITNTQVEDAKRPDVQRWLGQNVFEHCGIATAHDANGHEGCTVLDAQHRFGPEIMRLANAIAYDGALKPGRNTRPHDDDDPEIVLIDTDGLEDLATVRSVGRHSGWWPAGALAQVAAMLRAGQVHAVRAAELVTPTAMGGPKGSKTPSALGWLSAIVTSTSAILPDAVEVSPALRPELFQGSRARCHRCTDCQSPGRSQRRPGRR